MFGGLGKIFKGDPAKKTRERLQPLVDNVSALEGEMQTKSDDELRGLTRELQDTARGGVNLEDLLPRAFAVRGIWPGTLGSPVVCILGARCRY